jgi:hypothetical protein
LEKMNIETKNDLCQEGPALAALPANTLELEIAESPKALPVNRPPLVKNVVTFLLEKKDWEQKSLKMFYFKPNVANGKIVQIKGK